MKRALLDLFLGERLLIRPILDGSLITALQTYPNTGAEFFSSTSSRPPVPKLVKQLILMLLAGGILTHNVIFDEEDEARWLPIVLARLTVNEAMNLVLYDDNVWQKLPLRPSIVQ